ncbi:hypothetical protein [Kocuria aegyptia]|uniref:Secreted protein n=1 Tax=Kocuria aegyptia TaxID=330943 RepID=A0ABP4X0Y3_9MICC
MNKHLLSGIAATTFAASLAFAAPASAAVTLNTDGTGFVGKGDVQLALNLNNAQVQNGSFVFAAVSTTVSEYSWECTNSNNEKVQPRESTTTTSTSGLVSADARVKNQITGWDLKGYTGTLTESSTSEGPKLNSCPNSAGSWTLTTPAGEPEVVSSSSSLTVNGVPLS